ncbi:MAG: ATP synthase F1 subunit gamma [Bacteroidetes bacterium]|nr:ATP synthase F1 subunit gamma [Bacteroidota bacterium]MDA1118949.1 ATP synthase F1 subunit gamma [Bacteroidota bacterium]
MANLKEVRGRIKSVMSTQQITKAMKMVAAAKLRRAQDRMVQMRPYARRLNSLLQNVSAGVDPELVGNYGKERVVDSVLLVVITSDRGLCGPFNGNIFKAVSQNIQDNYASVQKRGKLTILPIGKKAYDFYRKRDYRVDSKFYELLNKLDFEIVKETAEYVMSSFDEGEFDRVEIVYNEFKNVAQQIIRVEQYLPIPLVVDEENPLKSGTDYILEPSKELLVREIIPKSLKIQLYKTLLESNAAEQGARMTAMDQATDNADELLKDLRLTYNRTRQAAITKEILEIVGGAEALQAS